MQGFTGTAFYIFKRDFQETLRELQKRAARSVDIALVIRNWLFGWYIVEFEQGGANRAELYGKRLIERIAAVAGCLLAAPLTRAHNHGAGGEQTGWCAIPGASCRFSAYDRRPS